MDEPVFAHVPADPEQRIQRLYAWVAIADDGMEGVMSLGVLGNFVPMVCTQRRNAVALEGEAHRIAAVSARAGKPVRIELRVFDLAGLLRPE